MQVRTILMVIPGSEPAYPPGNDTVHGDPPEPPVTEVGCPRD